MSTIHNKISWGWYPNLNMKLIYVSFTHSLWVMFHIFLVFFLHETMFVYIEPSESKGILPIAVLDFVAV